MWGGGGGFLKRPPLIFCIQDLWYLKRPYWACRYGKNCLAENSRKKTLVCNFTFAKIWKWESAGGRLLIVPCLWACDKCLHSIYCQRQIVLGLLSSLFKVSLWLFAPSPTLLGLILSMIIYIDMSFRNTSQSPKNTHTFLRTQMSTLKPSSQILLQILTISMLSHDNLSLISDLATW